MPGRFNQANALMAAVAATALGVDAEAALRAMKRVEEVAGRFTVRRFGPVQARLMLAKNPAGWDELLDLVARSEAPLVVSINARVADGADPSWLWDVPFERLEGRRVVATGDRFRDLSVRLQYAGVAHATEADPVQAVRAAADGDGAVTESDGSDGVNGADGVDGLDGLDGLDGVDGVDGVVDVIGNYTAFGDLLRARV